MKVLAKMNAFIFTGIDNNVVSYGGLLSYSHGSGSSPLPFPRSAGLRVLLINTRVSRNTRAQVDKVRAMLARQPKLTGRILEAMDQVSKKRWTYYYWK